LIGPNVLRVWEEQRQRHEAEQITSEQERGANQPCP
jgi:hypothetical protein